MWYAVWFLGLLIACGVTIRIAQKWDEKGEKTDKTTAKNEPSQDT